MEPKRIYVSARLIARNQPEAIADEGYEPLEELSAYHLLTEAGRSTHWTLPDATGVLATEPATPALKRLVLRPTLEPSDGQLQLDVELEYVTSAPHQLESHITLAQGTHQLELESNGKLYVELHAHVVADAGELNATLRRMHAARHTLVNTSRTPEIGAQSSSAPASTQRAPTQTTVAPFVATRDASGCHVYPRRAAALLSAPPPTAAPGLSYAAALRQSRERARREKADQSTVLEAERASVETYKFESMDGGRVELHLVAEGYPPWVIEGSAETRVESVSALRGGPFVAQLRVGGCDWGSCGRGCDVGASARTLLQWHNELALVPFGGPRGDHLFDADGDKLLELETEQLEVGLDACTERWCCGYQQAFTLPTYAGWSEQCWSTDLPRFERLYETQLQRARAQATKLRSADRSQEVVRCDLARWATAALWLGTITSDQGASLRAPWQADLEGFSPTDCYPRTREGALLRELAISRDEFQRRALAAPVPALDTTAPDGSR